MIARGSPIALIALLFSQGVAGQPNPPAQATFVVPPVAETDEFRYARYLFPEDSSPGDDTVVESLSDETKSGARDILGAKLDHLRETLNSNDASIRYILNSIDIPAKSPFNLSAPVKLEVIDGPKPVAHAGVDGTVMVSGVTLRGFALGAFEDGLKGDSVEGLMVRSALGWRGSAASADKETIALRLQQLLSLAELAGGTAVKPADQEESAREIFRDEDDGAEPDRFGRIASEILDEGRKITAQEAYAIWMAYFFVTNSLSGPAETFLLAHELGHVALRHSPRQDCEASARQERDADSFAAVLLAYDMFAGGVDVIFYQTRATLEDWAPAEYLKFGDELDGVRAKYGFAQAFKYGMENAGMKPAQDSACPFVPGAARLSATDRIWRRVITMRLDAIRQLAFVLRANPPFVFRKEYDVLLSAAEEDALLDEWRPRCLGVPAYVQKNPTVGLGLKYTYFVKCARKVPRHGLTVASQLLIGPSYLRNWLAAYGPEPSPTDQAAEAEGGAPLR